MPLPIPKAQLPVITAASSTVVAIRRRVDSKKRPQSVSIEHLQLCDLWGSGKGNLSKRKWHQHKKTWWFTQSQITPFHRHLAVLLSQELDRRVPPLGIMGRREKSKRKHLYTNDSRKKSEDAKQKAFSLHPWLSILPPLVLKAQLLARLFRHCSHKGGRSQRRGYQKKRDNLLLFVDI